MRARALAAALLALLAAACHDEQPRPSVILISIDTLRADHMGLYGYERDTTPFLDRFAKDALVFEHAFTAAPWTLIAHMTMLTGLYPEQHGVQEGDVALGDVPILAERLQRAGYRTLGLYHPGWIHERYGFARGFDVFRGHGDADEAGKHLREEFARLERDRPFFLFLHLFDVHSGGARDEGFTIYTSPAPYQEYFVGDDAPRLHQLPYEELRTARNGIPDDALDLLVKLYDGGVRHVDAELGTWLGELEAGGWLANTLVVVTADHGESLWQRGRFAGHGGVFQEGVHVPLIVRPPPTAAGPVPGARSGEPVHHIDIVPTVLDVVGLPADPRLPGHSLLRPLPARRTLAGFHPPVGYVVDWPHKIMTSQRRFVSVDLDSDPEERQRLDVTRAEYDALRAGLPDLAPLAEPSFIGDLPEDEKQALRDLGYAGEVDGE